MGTGQIITIFFKPNSVFGVILSHATSDLYSAPYQNIRLDCMQGMSGFHPGFVARPRNIQRRQGLIPEGIVTFELPVMSLEGALAL